MKAVISRSTFSILLLTLLTLSSCNKKDITYKAQEEQTQEQEQFLSIKFNKPNEVTLRAGTAHEDPMLKIERLRLVFYRGTEGSEVVAKVINKTFSDEIKEGFNVKLVPNDYKLVVLANSSQALNDLTTLGSPLKKLSEAQNLQTSNIYNHDNQSGKISIAMANEQGAISIARSLFHAEKSLSTGSAPIEVQLEPMLARVLVFGTPQINGTKPEGLEASYLINNLARSCAPLRPLAKLSSGEQETQGDKSLREKRYALSSLWTKWAENMPTNTDLIGTYSEEAYQMAGNWQTIQATREAYDEVLDTSVIPYAKETTLPPTAYLQGLTPCVIIKYPYAPKGLSLQSNEGWLSYQGTYYTESQAKALLASNAPETSQLKTALQQANITEEDFNKGFQKGDIAFYHQAYNYYTVYIRHFTEAKAKDAYGRYGIVRANEYRIEIKHIEQEGKPTAPIMANNLEAISEHENASLKVSISELTARNQEVAL